MADDSSWKSRIGLVIGPQAGEEQSKRYCILSDMREAVLYCNTVVAVTVYLNLEAETLLRW